MIKPIYGDVLCVNQGIYNHFGIYVDDNHVIHYSGKNEDFFLRKMVIRETSMEDFLGGSTRYYVYKFSQNDPSCIERVRANGLDRDIKENAYALYILYQIKNKVNFRIYSPEQTVKRARSKIGERKYSLVSNNCEHFCIWCKTGVIQSYQVNAVLKAVFTKIPIEI